MRKRWNGAVGTLLPLGFLLLIGCATWGEPSSSKQNVEAEEPEGLIDADTAFTLEPVRQTDSAAPLPSDRMIVELHMMLVQVPFEGRKLAEKVWNHVRENALPSEQSLLLRRNGVRVGVGHEQWWDAVKAALDAVEGTQVNLPDPVRIPPNYPLALELDSEPHDQTLFFMDYDGILTGSTWLQGRNVLRVSYVLDARGEDRVLLSAVPEVRQRQTGLRWIRTEAGLWQVPRFGGRAFPAAGFSVGLEPGEFVLIAPSDKAGLFGLVGGAFLTEEKDGQRLDAYVFLRPVVKHDDAGG